jgi:hypothetical protein
MKIKSRMECCVTLSYNKYVLKQKKNEEILVQIIELKQIAVETASGQLIKHVFQQCLSSCFSDVVLVISNSLRF